MFRNGPEVLGKNARLRVGKGRIRLSGKRGLPDKRAVGAQRLDFAALRGLRVAHAGDIEAGGELVGSEPVAGGGGDGANGLQAASSLVQKLKVIAAGAIEQENEGLRTLRRVVEGAVVAGNAQFEKRIAQAELVLESGETAPLIGSDGGGQRIEGIEAEIFAVGAVIEKRGVQNMSWRKVVLQAEKIVAGPSFGGIRAGGLLFYDRKGVLKADGIGEPKAPAPDRPGKGKSGIPVAKVNAFTDVDAGKRIGGAEAPAIVAFRCFEAQDAQIGRAS